MALLLDMLLQRRLVVPHDMRTLNELRFSGKLACNIVTCYFLATVQIDCTDDRFKRILEVVLTLGAAIV